MSTNEDLPQSEDFSPEEAITIQPSSISAYSGAGDWSPAGSPDAGQESISAMALLHAVRRHWLVILSTGLACAAVTGTLLFASLKPKYQAEAMLKLESMQPQVMSQTADQRTGPNEFEIFCGNQKVMLLSRFVVNAALRDQKLKNRPCLKREDDKHNAIGWLTGEIKVDIPKGAGVMLVSATEPDGEDAAAMVNAVVFAYKRDVVDKERDERLNKLSELTAISNEKESEVRKKREDLRRELENLGTGDEQTIALHTQMTQALYTEALREQQRMKVENRSLAGRIAEDKAYLRDLDLPDFEIGETEIAMILNGNPIYRDFLTRRAGLQQMVRFREERAGQGSKPTPGHQQTAAELSVAEQQIKELERKASQQVRDAKKIDLKREIRRLDAQFEVSTGQLALFDKEVDKKKEDAESLGKSSINAQMQKAEVENLERILHDLAGERERLRVEIKSKPRVEILGDQNSPAAVPESETRDFRLAIVLLGSALAMALPGLVIVVWDLRTERINSASDVSKRLKLPVMGAVPMIPALVMRRLGDPTQRSRIWKMRFTEAVDGVAARLLRKAECDQTRVVLVTSAMSGEGKTTLATQLAMSLARAHRNTVLVDFDLRQPTLDGALGLPLGPGICEALRGDGNVLDMVQQTDTEFLSVVTAGAWNRRIPAALGNGAVRSVLEQLRKNFDFVIIDSSPLLPVVDTRLVSQDVDAVVLSVFRDVSRGAKVLAAQELLDAFGARCVEVVITGGEEHSHAKNLVRHAALLDEQAAPVENNNVD